MLASCTADPTPAERAQRAERLSSEGRIDEAVEELKFAIEAVPTDGEMRARLAELYLDLGRGDLAEVLLDQAVVRGIAERELLGTRARALIAQRAYQRVLTEVKITASLPATTRLELSMARADAELSLARAPDDLTVARGFVAVVRLLEEIPEGARDDAWHAVAERIAALRGTPAVDRAEQHTRCGIAAEVVSGWEPSAQSAAALGREPSAQSAAALGREPSAQSAAALGKEPSAQSAAALDRQPIPERASQVVRVGPGAQFATPAAAAAQAPDGARIEIEAGEYPGGVALWRQNGLHVVGVNGRPHVTANGKHVEARDVWLFTGNDVIVENIELSGARAIAEKNGAALRHTGRNLTLRHVHLHHSENGLMTGNNHADSAILIEHSEFDHNGDGEGFAHNLYVGYSDRLVFRYNYSHASAGGHLLKSRAAHTSVAYNRLSDEEEGTSSYTIDVPNAGDVEIVGNVLEQGAGSVNHTMIAYGAEGQRYEENRLFVVNNTIYNRDIEAVAVTNHTPIEARLINNLFAGAPVIQLKGTGSVEADLVRVDHGLENPREFLFSPGADSPAVDSGTDLVDDLAAFQPIAEYVHPVQYRPRRSVWRIDIGAYERCGI